MESVINNTNIFIRYSTFMILKIYGLTIKHTYISNKKGMLITLTMIFVLHQSIVLFSLVVVATSEILFLAVDLPLKVIDSV